MNSIEELKSTESFARQLFNHFCRPELRYHNLNHTINVVTRAIEIAEDYSISETDLFILITAAWFHDSGHLFGTAEGHEQKSVFVLRAYLEKREGVFDIDAIEEMILSTKLPYNPKSFLGEILCDADSYNLGTEEFLVSNQLVKEELELRTQYVPTNWDQGSIDLLEQHHYFTTYCRLLLEPGKEKNLQLLKSKIKGAGSEVKVSQKVFNEGAV